MSEPDANGWLPIETAPKDGTHVLGVFDFDFDDVVGEVVYYPNWVPNQFHDWLWSTPADTFPVSPRHWQPLPKPPVSQSLSVRPNESETIPDEVPPPVQASSGPKSTCSTPFDDPDDRPSIPSPEASGAKMGERPTVPSEQGDPRSRIVTGNSGQAVNSGVAR